MRAVISLISISCCMARSERLTTFVPGLWISWIAPCTSSLQWSTLLATYEFVHSPQVPYRVVINEAVELGKSFGGTDGHKYINGVLDKLAAILRPHG